MKRLQVFLLALVTISFVLPTAVVSADPPSAGRALVLPITGSASGGITFKGTVAVQRFVQRNDENGVLRVFAMGAVSGSLAGPTGPIGTSLVLPVTFPVRIGDAVTTHAERGRINPTSLSAPGYGGRVILAQATCGVLHLALGAVDLNLLGVAVTTTPVTIDINGDTGGALGNLVCAVLDTVNNVVGVVNLLNSLLGVVTGLLGGLTGGLAGGLGGVLPM
jgi:hypothetical protein